MATSLVLQLEKHAKIEEPSPNVPFSVEDANSVWVVQAGKLDLFTIGKKNGELFGARHHVLRVEAGQAVIGVGSHLQDAALVASAGPETRLLCLSTDQLCRLSRSDDAKDDLTTALIEGWIIRLTMALSEDFTSGPFITLQPGRTVVIREESKAIVPAEGVVWITHRQGYSRFRASNTLPPIQGTGFFPVTRHGWLQVAPGGEIQCADSPALLRTNEIGSGLRQFHSVVTACLDAQRKQAEEKERSLMHVRMASDANLLQSALFRLVSPIHKIQELQEGDDACSNLVFRACEAIGKRLSITIKPHPDMLRGLTPVDAVAGIAQVSGIRVRRVALKAHWWKYDSGPLLAFTEEGNSPVALLPRSARSYHYYDPVSGRTAPVNQEVAANLNPFAYVFYRPFPAKQLTAWDLLKFGLVGCRRELILILLMGVATGLLGVITPYATGVIFDRLIPGAERTQLAAMAAFLFVIAVATALFTFTRSFAMLRLEGKLDASIQAAIWDRLLSLPVSFFREYTSGDLAQRSLGIAAIRQTLTGSTLTAILSGVFSIFSFGLLFYYSWRLALLATVVIICASAVSIVCGVLQLRLQRQVSRMDGAISSMLLQFITGISKFRVSGTERRAFALWAREFSKMVQVAIQSRVVSNTLTVFNSVFPLMAVGAIFLHNHILMSGGGALSLTTGDFVAFLMAFLQFLVATVLLSSALISALAIVPVYERARPILQALPEVTGAKASPGKLSGAIEVSHISFRYRPDMPLVLRDLSVKILPGQFVAFVGSSGSGKSTLFRLLLGFESPEMGAVYYDGQDLSGLDVQAVRRQIGVVMQSSRPYSGTIFNNIVGSAPLSVTDAWEAARLAGIAEDIKRMPMGLHTYLGEGGSGISGGQRQRLMIARAIVGRPRVLLFDEATSALDNHTQAVVSRSLESLQATRIVIAHRLSTVIRADVIFVIDKGVLVDSGTYEELINKEGVFRDLAKRQMT